MNIQLTERDRERAVSAIFESSGLEFAGEPTGELLHDAVLVFAKRAGMAPFEWVLSTLIGGGGSARGAVKVAAKKTKYANVEADGDAAVSDEAIVALLKAEDFNFGVRSKDWAGRAAKLGLSNGGFYLRLEKLVAAKAVLVSESKEKKVIFGREVMATVKDYYDPETLKATDLDEYNRLMGAEVARG